MTSGGMFRDLYSPSRLLSHSSVFALSPRNFGTNRLPCRMNLTSST
ncbi:MAG: hypothetical protein ACYTKD_24475 [Planctomycetota bacterium]|jgi:hypothetical protein